jgi:lipoate-protein ligase A
LSQTPQFTLKLDPANPAREDLDAHLEMTVHHGIIKSFDYNSTGCPESTAKKACSLLVGQKLQDVGDWHRFLRSNIHGEKEGISKLADYLEEFLPIPEAPAS